MARYSGMIGYEESAVEDPVGSGIYVDRIVERPAKGDLQWESARWNSSGGINDKLSLSHKVSIVADPYASQHYANIKYAMVYGTPWKVTSIEVQRPRLILSLGEVWNGSRPGSSQV